MSRILNNIQAWFLPNSVLAMPSFRIASGSIEALKWLAVVFMTIDHINRYLLHGAVGSMFALGRLTMPIFAFTLAYHLAQPHAFANGMHVRVMRRLVPFAVISSIPYIALNKLVQGWWPLNILFMLLIGTGMIALLESNIRFRNYLALLIFLVGGAVVEFWWVGLALFYFSWRYVKSPNLIVLIGAIIALFLLGNVNGNQWAFASLMIIFLAPFVNINIPRIKHVLYLYYPVHLFCIWGVVGYLSYIALFPTVKISHHSD